MGMLCCFGIDSNSKQPTVTLPGVTKPQEPASSTPALVSGNGNGKGPPTRNVSRLSIFKGEDRHANGGRTSESGKAVQLASSTAAHGALLQLLPVLTSLDGGWWDQLERAVVATAQHLSAKHACIFLLSSDASSASPLALAGPPAPPLCIGAPLPIPPLPAAGPAVTGIGPTVSGTHVSLALSQTAAANDEGERAAAAAAGSAGMEAESAGGGGGAPGTVGREGSVSAAAAAAATAAGAGAGEGQHRAGGCSAGASSCAAAALLAEQLDKDPDRLLIFTDVQPEARWSLGGGLGRTSGGPLGGSLPTACPPEWRHLASTASSTAPHPAAGDAPEFAAAAAVGKAGGARAAGAGSVCRHFAAVAIPVGHQPLGVLSLGAEGPSRPASWNPETLHCAAALLSAPLRVPQVDLASRALAELSSASTIHQLVRIILGAAAELVVTVTRIETQARVAFLQPDVEAAAVFQTAATDMLGPAVRRRMSEVLLVDTSVAAAAPVAGTTGGGAGAGGGFLAEGRASARGPRRSLGGNETVASRSPSLAAAAVMLSDLHGNHLGSSSRGAAAEEVPVCRGHSLPLKHTLLSEALSQGTGGLCISDCNAYVQDSKVYPRDLAVSRGAAPAQSLALATSCHCGRPLLALYATYHSILPQGLLQAVVQELGQLLRALTASVASKVEGSLSVEWGYLRLQLLESMRNRSLRSMQPFGNTNNQSSSLKAATAIATPAANQPAVGSVANGMVAQPTSCESPAVVASGSPARQHPNANVVQRLLLDGALDSPNQPQSVAGSTVVLPLDAVSSSLGLATSGPTRAGQRDGRMSGRASFSLEAASSPRGSCKLAPLIATLHDRLKAAQAEQMANCRAASRMQDLESIRILEQIGRGGYGVVYRGLYHGSEVAIKVIQEAEVAAADASGSGGGNGGGLKRMNSVALENKHLHDAIELVASVGMGGHPNIVQVLTFFTDVRLVVGEQPLDTLNRRLSGLDGVAELLRLTRMPSALEGREQLAGQDGSGECPSSGGGVIVLVQEFCDAGTLKTAINQRAFYRNTERPSSNRGLQLNLRAVYTTLLEMALALRHMHGLHMVHCDLKPQNVLLKSSPRDPRGFTAKLSDFGLAKMMAHDEDGQLVIDEAVGSGTLTHMAPESLAGQKQLTAGIDMFAFGILMWQMVCGTRLYQGLNTRQIIRGVVRENLRPSFPAWVPVEYRRLAERCWHQNPSERPSASTVVSELEAMTLGDPARAGWRAWRPGGTTTTASSAAAGAIGTGGGGGIDAGLGPRHAQQLQPLPHPHAHPQPAHGHPSPAQAQPLPQNGSQPPVHPPTPQPPSTAATPQSPQSLHAQQTQQQQQEQQLLQKQSTAAAAAAGHTHPQPYSGYPGIGVGSDALTAFNASLHPPLPRLPIRQGPPGGVGPGPGAGPGPSRLII